MPMVHLLGSSIKLNAGKTKKFQGTISNHSCGRHVNRFSKKMKNKAAKQSNDTTKKQRRADANSSFAQLFCQAECWQNQKMPGNNWQLFLQLVCQSIFQKMGKEAAKQRGSWWFLCSRNLLNQKRISKSQGRPGLSCLQSVVDNQMTQQ